MAQSGFGGTPLSTLQLSQEEPAGFGGTPAGEEPAGFGGVPVKEGGFGGTPLDPAPQDSTSVGITTRFGTRQALTSEQVQQNQAHDVVLNQLSAGVKEYEDQFSFLERQSIRLGKGNTRLQANAMLREMASLQEQLVGLQNLEPEALKRFQILQSPKGALGPPVPDAEREQTIQSLQTRYDAIEQEYLFVSDAVMNPTSNDATGTARDVPEHPVMQALQQAQLAGDQKLVNRIGREFLPETIAEVALPSMTQAGWSQLLIPGGLATVGKLALGSTTAARVGFVAGTGFVSGHVESNAAFSEFLQENGVDITNTAEIANALSDPELVRKGRAFATKRSISIAMWDMAGGYIASRKIMPPGLTNKFAQQISNVAAQVVAQPLTGLAGEATAQIVAGQEPNLLEIKLEAIGELPSAITEPVIFHLADKLGGKPKDYGTVEQILDAFIKNPEMTMGEALTALQEVASRGMTEAEAIKMLEAIPGVTLDTEAILGDRLHMSAKDSKSGFQENPLLKHSLRATLYGTTSGEILTGDQILDAEKGTGKVYWATDQMLADPVSGEASGIGVGTTARSLDAIELLISQAQADLNIVMAQQAPSTIVNQLSDELETLKERKAQFQQDEKVMSDLRPRLQGLLQEMVSLFMPNTDMLVIENSFLRDHFEDKSVLGTTNSNNSTVTGKRTQLLYLNTRKLIDLDMQANPKRKHGPRTFATMASVMGHEFGHAIAMTWFNKLPTVIRQALQVEHRNWLAKALKENKEETLLQDITGSKNNPAQEKDVNPNFNGRHPIKVVPKKMLNYHLSFTEFVADLMARQLAGNKESTIVAPLTKKFLPRLQTLMRRYFDKYRDQNVFSADQTYDTFLQYLRATAQTTKMEEIKGQFSDTELAMPAGNQAENVFRLLDSKVLNIDSEIRDEVMSNLDTYNKLMRYGATILQLGKENKHIAGLQKYIRAVHEHWITKSNWNDAAMKSMNAWRKLGKSGDELGRFLIELTVKSDELGRALTNDEIQELIDEKRINFGDKAPQAWEVYARVKGDLANALQELYIIEKNRINQDWAEFETQRKAKIQELDTLFSKLRNRNYFPLSRFGVLGIAMKAKESVQIAGRGYAKGEVMHMELFEGKRQRNKAIGRLRRKYGPKVQETFFAVDEDMKPFAGLPIAIMRQLKQNDKLRLTPEQKTKLQDMIDTMSPTQSIAKRMLERKGTAGFSNDAQRGYGNYMLMMGGHIAKMRHIGEMDAAIDSVRKSARYLGERGIINDKRNEIAGHLTRHQDYLLNPVNEWGGMRALAFLWFLGYNVKSAIVNLTQVPLVAYPYLAARVALTGGTTLKSDAIAIAALTKAGLDVANLFRKGINKYTVDEQEMLSVLQSEGIIDESLATELAGVAHGDMISRNMPKETAFTTNVQRGSQQFLRGSTWMFQAAEKYNRRVVGLAAYRLAREKNMDTQTSIDEAREAIRATQFEYARWNRAAFMRGKPGVFFVFMQYLQNVLYFVTRDPGKTRYMLMMFMAAGLQGLPGAEDFLDLYDFAGNKLKKWTGSKRDPRTDVREDLRRMIMSLHASPELIMHGLSAQSFGLGMTSVNDMLGTSLPALSFENSISAGRVIPGWEGLMKFFGGGRVGQAGQVAGAKDVLGAAITIPINILQWRMDADPSELRAFERMAPSVIKGATRAFRIASGANEEGISTFTDRQGRTIADFDMNNYEHIAELIGMSLGAVPTRIQRVQEAKWAEKEALQFYGEMRVRLQVNFNYSMEDRRTNPDGVKEVKKAIKDFNASVPKGQQLLNFGQSYMDYKLGIEFDKKGVGRRMLDQPVRGDIQETFPAATEERIK